MALHRIDPRGLPADPFLTTVRRRHPDVDIVLLPPPPAAAPSLSSDPSARAGDEPVAAAHVRSAGAAVDAAAESLRGWIPEADLDLAWRPGGVAGTVQRSVVARAVRPDGAELLDRLRTALRGAGWETHGRATALIARARPLTLVGSVVPSTGQLLVRITGDDVVVGRDRAAALLQEGGLR